MVLPSTTALRVQRRADFPKGSASFTGRHGLLQERGRKVRAKSLQHWSQQHLCIHEDVELDSATLYCWSISLFFRFRGILEGQSEGENRGRIVCNIRIKSIYVITRTQEHVLLGFSRWYQSFWRGKSARAGILRAYNQALSIKQSRRVLRQHFLAPNSHEGSSPHNLPLTPFALSSV